MVIEGIIKKSIKMRKMPAVNKLEDHRLSEEQVNRINRYVQEQIHKKIIPLAYSPRLRRHRYNCNISQQISDTQADKKLPIQFKRKNLRAGSLNGLIEFPKDSRFKPQKQQQQGLSCRFNSEFSENQQFDERIMNVFTRAQDHIKTRKKSSKRNNHKCSRFSKLEGQFSFSQLYNIMNKHKLRARSTRTPHNATKIQSKQNLNPLNSKDVELKDEMDKQLEEGLVEYMYSTKRVKLRVKINKQMEVKRCQEFNQIYRDNQALNYS